MSTVTENIANLPPLGKLVHEADLSAKKSLGQNFLFDLNLTGKIARTAAPLNRTVLEIGPGPGGLTRALLMEDAPKVIAVEKDKRVTGFLQHLTDAAQGRLELIQADALELELSALTSDRLDIIANLPYNIATPLLISFLRQADYISNMVLMFQREVALRITAQAGEPSYGRLAVITAWRAQAEFCFDVPAEAFTPAPKVTSSIVRITPLPQPLSPCRMSDLEAVTQIAFGQRRKMLRASFKRFGGEKMLKELNIDPSLRPQDLPVSDFCNLALHLSDRL